MPSVSDNSKPLKWSMRTLRMYATDFKVPSFIKSPPSEPANSVKKSKVSSFLEQRLNASMSLDFGKQAAGQGLNGSLERMKAVMSMGILFSQPLPQSLTMSAIVRDKNRYLTCLIAKTNF